MHGHVHGQTTAVGSFTRVPRLNAHGLMPNSIYGWVGHCKPPRRARLASLLYDHLECTNLLKAVPSVRVHTQSTFWVPY